MPINAVNFIMKQPRQLRQLGTQRHLGRCHLKAAKGCRQRHSHLPRLDVVEILEGVCKEVGFPATIRVDQGSEFVSRDLDLWAYQRGVTLDFSRPGKPTDNAFIWIEAMRVNTSIAVF